MSLLLKCLEKKKKDCCPLWNNNCYICLFDFSKTNRKKKWKFRFSFLLHVILLRRTYTIIFTFFFLNNIFTHVPCKQFFNTYIKAMEDSFKFCFQCFKENYEYKFNRWNKIWSLWRWPDCKNVFHFHSLVGTSKRKQKCMLFSARLDQRCMSSIVITLSEWMTVV